MEPGKRGDGRGRESGAHLHKVKRNRGRRKRAADIVKTQAQCSQTLTQTLRVVARALQSNLQFILQRPSGRMDVHFISPSKRFITVPPLLMKKLPIAAGRKAAAGRARAGNLAEKGEKSRGTHLSATGDRPPHRKLKRLGESDSQIGHTAPSRVKTELD